MNTHDRIRRVLDPALAKAGPARQRAAAVLVQDCGREQLDPMLHWQAREAAVRSEPAQTLQIDGEAPSYEATG